MLKDFLQTVVSNKGRGGPESKLNTPKLGNDCIN